MSRFFAHSCFQEEQVEMRYSKLRGPGVPDTWRGPGVPRWVAAGRWPWSSVVLDV